MHTKDKLAMALRQAGLDDMAKLAAEGHYHDFLSPLDFPELTLEQHLRSARGKEVMGSPRWRQIEAIRKDVINGEFDASLEESEEWAASPEGQEVFGRLVRGE